MTEAEATANDLAEIEKVKESMDQISEQNLEETNVRISETGKLPTSPYRVSFFPTLFWKPDEVGWDFYEPTWEPQVHHVVTPKKS